MKRHCLSTLYGVGLIRIAPGTWGSLVAALIAYPILKFVPYGYAVLTAGAFLFTLLGTVNAQAYMRNRNTSHDPSEIVVDELIGQWFTYSVWFAFLYAMAGTAEAARELLDDVAATPLFLALGFVLFRLFDILKPWPISWADRRVKGGFGVMFDDVLAAIPAGTLLYIAYLFSPYLFGHLEVTP